MKREKKTIPPGEVVCRMQRGNSVTKKWCNLAQYDEICKPRKGQKKCDYNAGREVSKYTQQKGSLEGEQVKQLDTD